LLEGLIACLSGIIGLSPNGVAGYVQSVEQVDLVSIPAPPIAIAIVLMYRLGFSIAYVEEIEPKRPWILPRVSRRDRTGQPLRVSPGKWVKLDMLRFPDKHKLIN